MRPTWGDERDRRYRGGPWLPFNWNSIPVTRALLFTTVGCFLLYFFTGQEGGPVFHALAYLSDLWYRQPWTWITYPFLEVPGADGLGWLFALLDLYILYSLGGMLERSWGSVNYLVLFLAFSAVGALAFVIPLYLLGRPVQLLGLAIPLTGLVTAWAALDPEMDVSFWGLPLKAKFMAALWVGMMYFNFGTAHRDPVLALFILAVPAAAYFYVRKLPRLNLGWKLPSPGGGRGSRGRGGSFREALLRREPPRERPISSNPLKRKQEQQEIERLRKLLGDDDDHPTRH